MGIFRPDRDRRGPDPMLDHKILVFVLGAVVALAGIASGNRIIVYLAIAILGAGIALRLSGRKRD